MYKEIILSTLRVMGILEPKSIGAANVGSLNYNYLAFVVDINTNSRAMSPSLTI